MAGAKVYRLCVSQCTTGFFRYPRLDLECKGFRVLMQCSLSWLVLILLSRDRFAVSSTAKKNPGVTVKVILNMRAVTVSRDRSKTCKFVSLLSRFGRTVSSLQRMAGRLFEGREQ